jgi:hypothetical protein
MPVASDFIAPKTSFMYLTIYIRRNIEQGTWNIESRSEKRIKNDPYFVIRYSVFLVHYLLHFKLSFLLPASKVPSHYCDQSCQ